MESKYLISAPWKPVPNTSDKNTPGLNVMEFFMDTIQGEGLFVGQPSAFLRLQGCTLDCVWCDTEWRKGRFLTFNELFVLMEQYALVERLRLGHHWVITGGSPLKQQMQLTAFLYQFIHRYGFEPVIEIENECVLYPLPELAKLVFVWNNSPKLESSGMKLQARYKSDVISYMGRLHNSAFKFVVSKQDDWNEIDHSFLRPGLIKRSQIILMPLGATLKELEINRIFAAECAIANSVRYTTREQVILNKP